MPEAGPSRSPVGVACPLPKHAIEISSPLPRVVRSNGFKVLASEELIESTTGLPPLGDCGSVITPRSRNQENFGFHHNPLKMQEGTGAVDPPVGEGGLGLVPAEDTTNHQQPGDNQLVVENTVVGSFQGSCRNRPDDTVGFDVQD